MPSHLPNTMSGSFVGTRGHREMIQSCEDEHQSTTVLLCETDTSFINVAWTISDDCQQPDSLIMNSSTGEVGSLSGMDPRYIMVAVGPLTAQTAQSKPSRKTLRRRRPKCC